MNATSGPPTHPRDDTHRGSVPVSTRRLRAGVAVASAAVGAWEVGVARLAGLLYGRTLAWVCLSLALLALGLGGWWAARRLDRGAAPDRLLRRAAAGLPLTLVLAGQLCGRFDLAWITGAFAWPFAVFGVAVTCSWRLTRPTEGQRDGRSALYRWELGGAAAGLALAGPAAVAYAGAPGACATGAVLAASSAWALRGRSSTGALVGGAAALAATLALLVGTPQDPAADGPGFENHLRRTAQAHGARWLETRHSAWARTDALVARARVEPPRDAAGGAPEGEALTRHWVFTDGLFVARSVPWNGRDARFALAADERLARLKRVAFRARPDQRRVLVVGAGAGFDVAVALQEGAQRVTAVEINGDTVALARSWAVHNGAVLARPEVDVVVADARRWVARSSERWDQVLLALVETAPASVRGHVTAHGRLLTREALQLWRSRLSAEGLCVIVHNTPRLHRATIRQLRGLLGARYADHVVALHVPDAAPEVDPFSHVVLWSRRPWRPDERARALAVAAQAGALATVASAPAPVGQPALTTDDRPQLYERAPVSLAVAVLLLALVGLGALSRGGARRRPLIAAALAGAGLCWLQVVGTAWASAALGRPSLALGLTLAAMLFGAGAGTHASVVAERPWLAALSAAVLAAGGPPLAEALAALPEAPAAALWALAVALVAAPLGGPWLAALAQAAGPAAARDGAEGRVVAADGLGALAAAGLVGVGLVSVGLSGLAAGAALCLAAASAALRR